MNVLDIAIAAAIVDFTTIVISKFFNMGKSLDKWYSKFGLTAVLSDVLVIILGIQLAMFVWPKVGVVYTAILAVWIQIIHDILFYFLVIETVPRGQNQMIDLFKEYAAENSWKIVVYDSAMISGTVFLADYLSKIHESSVNFIGLLTVYALTYIVYTK
jgi:uncharacterized protein YacL